MHRFKEKHPQAAAAAKWLGLGLLCVLAVWALLRLVPWALRLREADFRAEVLARLHEAGPRAVAVMLAIQVAQVVVAIIPGEPVELAAGVLFGGWGGFALCEVGLIFGQSLVFLLVRRFGRPLVEFFFARKKLDELKFLHDTQRLEITVFLLHLVPGTPKDLVCYLAGLTPMPLGRFLALSAVARIPSVISSTFAGAAVGSGNLAGSIVLFLVVGALGLGGILCRERVMRFLANHRHKG